MLLPAVDSPPRGVSVASSTSTPAPTGGWNARDNIANMKPDDALILDNWFPETDSLTLRKGFTMHSQRGFTNNAPVETLMAYNSATGGKLFAAVNGLGIYDCTLFSQVTTPDYSAITGARFQYVNFGTTGGQFIVAVNGVDDPINYNGSAWSTSPAITGSGLTASDFVNINVFKKRIFLIPKNTLEFWYLPVNSIGGTAVKFDLSSECKLGGYLMAMGTWTRDGGDGLDDLAVFITSQGELLLYQGTDPGDANAWQLIGNFRIGPPIGRRCFQKIGAELVIISKDGFLPLSRVLGSGRVGKEKISDKIVKAVTKAGALYGDNFGWQAILYPARNMGIFNVPVQEAATTHQYVVNTATGAWCRFTGINTCCWEIFNDELYFGALAGTNQLVMKFDNGFSDFGANRRGDVKPAFSYFGHRGRLKKFNNVRPVMYTDGDLSIAMETNVDFEDDAPDNVVASNGGTGSLWDVAEWDVSLWGFDERIVKDWQGATKSGHAGTVRMQIATRERDVSLFAFDWLYELGGYI